MKKVIRVIAHKTVLRPPYVRYCSQTIYESILGCMRMFEATAELKWNQRADRLLSILLQIQQPDGGFDIGYDFNFGLLHKKGQSTSPELVGLVALAEYGRLFGKDNVLDSAHRAANWIRKNAMDMGDGKYAIPYGPYSVSEVMVYNGVSFAAGALGCYLGHIANDEELHKIYNGMIAYLKSVMCSDAGLSGRYWYYNDQSRKDMTEKRRIKIDYYHQMQQVEMHALAQQACSADNQLDIIADGADLIVALQNEQEVIPYYNKEFSGHSDIHSWGLASVIPGMLEAAVVLPERKDAYHVVANRVLAWLIEYVWNGEYFIPVLRSDGRAISQDYMVRSDAWVFNALGTAQKYLGTGPWTDIAEQCFHRMESVDFSGPESHASWWLGRFVSSVYAKYRKMGK